MGPTVKTKPQPVGVLEDIAPQFLENSQVAGKQLRLKLIRSVRLFLQLLLALVAPVALAAVVPLQAEATACWPELFLWAAEVAVEAPLTEKTEAPAEEETALAQRAKVLMVAPVEVSTGAAVEAVQAQREADLVVAMA